MSELQEKSPVTKIITALVFCLLAGFIVVIIVPNLFRMSYEKAENGCINNLRQIEAAKQEWALENGRSNGVAVTESNIKPYLKLDSSGDLPTCPVGGTYVIGRVGEDPKCSIGTSAWPNSHVLNETNNWRTDFKATYSRLFGLHHADPTSK